MTELVLAIVGAIKQRSWNIHSGASTTAGGNVLWCMFNTHISSVLFQKNETQKTSVSPEYPIRLVQETIAKQYKTHPEIVGKGITKKRSPLINQGTQQIQKEK
jgi:hypothetical protein